MINENKDRKDNPYWNLDDIEFHEPMEDDYSEESDANSVYEESS